MCTALEKLREQGVKCGIEQGKLLMIRKMLAGGMTEEEVMRVTGVTGEEIRSAREEEGK